nr:RiPP maturation radical SAM C-methyltransferase [Propionicimonas sp.]
MTYSVAAPAAYGPAYRGQPGEGFAELLIEALRFDALSAGEWPEEDQSIPTRIWLTGLLRRAVADASTIVESVVNDIVARRSMPEVVAFSIAVDSQKLPSAAIAAELRRRKFDGIIVAGGSALDDIMGKAFFTRFPEFDAVLQGEAESNWADFLRSLDQDWRNADTPGLVRRVRGTVTANPSTIPGRLWKLSPGSFEPYISQRRSLRWDGPLVLPAESSRGCWWADVNRCTFCAVDPAAHPYRTQDPDYLADTVSREFRHHRPLQIALTDSCMPRGEDSDVLTALRARPEVTDWNLYYEVKSTLRRRQLEQFRTAGITEVQPGIESFSSDTLRDFGKGANLLQHVNFLKWCKFYGIAVTYPILYGAPTETALRLQNMATLIERIVHLPPPVQLNRLRMYRGSGYWHMRDQLEFEDIEPLACDQLGYDADGDAIEDLVFSFNYRLDRADAVEYAHSLELLRERVEKWQTSYPTSDLVYADSGAAMVVTRVEHGSAQLQVIDDPLAMAVLRGCEEVALLARLRTRLAADHEEFQRTVSRLVADNVLLEEGGRALNLAIPI